MANVTSSSESSCSSTSSHKPTFLRSGDLVRLMAPSSALSEEQRQRVINGIAILREWGLSVHEADIPMRRWGFLAGQDSERAADLSHSLSSSNDSPPPSLWACVRGGAGSARLLESEINVLFPSHGWLLGFSDITALLWANFKRLQDNNMLGAGMIGVHGPVLTSLAAEPEWSRNRLRSLLFGLTNVAEPSELDLPPLQGVSWRGGLATGRLLIGNLSVATNLIGTPHFPDTSGAILLIEDCNEAPYRVDRMLTHWRLCGALQKLAGIAIGTFNDCDDPEFLATAVKDEQGVLEGSIEHVLRNRTSDLGIPVIANIPVGHESSTGNAAFPMGAVVKLNGNLGTLEFIDF